MISATLKSFTVFLNLSSLPPSVWLWKNEVIIFSIPLAIWASLYLNISTGKLKTETFGGDAGMDCEQSVLRWTVVRAPV